MLCVWPLRLRLFGVWGLWWVLGCKKWFREGGQLVSTRFEERSRFRRSVMWVLLLSGAACSCARDGASWTLLLVSVEVSEARSSMPTIEVDTVHSDERTISLAVIFVFIIYVRFIGIFYYPETPSDLAWIAYLTNMLFKLGTSAATGTLSQTTHYGTAVRRKDAAVP